MFEHVLCVIVRQWGVSRFVSKKRLLDKQTQGNCFVDISSQRKVLVQALATKNLSVAINPISGWECLLSASAARVGNLPAGNLCKCVAGTRMPRPRETVFVLVTQCTGSGGECCRKTLRCPFHTGIWFLRPRLLPCCFCKHFCMPDPVGHAQWIHMHWVSQKKMTPFFILFFQHGCRKCSTRLSRTVALPLWSIWYSYYAECQILQYSTDYKQAARAPVLRKFELNHIGREVKQAVRINTFPCNKPTTAALSVVKLLLYVDFFLVCQEMYLMHCTCDLQYIQM